MRFGRRRGAAEREANDQLPGVEPEVVIEGGKAPRRGSWLSRRRATDPTGRVTWLHGDRVATRLLHAVLVAALISGPLTFVWTVLGGASTSAAGDTSVTAAPAGTEIRDATRAATAAQRLVTSWLTSSSADRETLQSLVREPLPTTLELPEKRPVAPAQIWAGEVRQVADRRYQVVVATSGGPLGTAFYVVPVAVTESAAIGLGLPSRTRIPSSDPGPDQDPSLSSIATDDPAYESAAGYVTANLTGSAELDRWTAPNAGLTAISPRACGGVRIDSVTTPHGDEATPSPQIPVVVTATCQTKGRPAMTSQYGLVLQVRDGRWEVAAEDPALLMDPTRLLAAQDVPTSTAASDSTPTPR